MNKYIVSGALTALLFASTVGIAKTAGWGGTPAEGAGFAWKSASSLDGVEAVVDHIPASDDAGSNLVSHSPEEQLVDAGGSNVETNTPVIPVNNEQSDGTPPTVEEPPGEGQQGNNQETESPVGTDAVDPIKDHDPDEIEDSEAPAEQATGVDDADEPETPDLKEDSDTEEATEGGKEPQEDKNSVGPSTKGWLAIVDQDIALDQSFSEVVEQWGSHYKEFHNAIDDSIVWQYALGAAPHSPVSDNPAEVNIAGLLAGHLEAQLFISWGSTQTVSSYALYYVDNGYVFEYRMFDDGNIRHTQISS